MAAQSTVGERRFAAWPAPMRWNFLTFGADIAFFSFGLSVSSAYTVLPLFVHRLSNTNEAVALIPAIRSLGMFAPQLLVAPFVERRTRMLPMILTLTTLERLPFLFLALGALALAGHNPGLLLGIFFAALLVTTLGSGLCYPGWLDMIARSVPSNWIGRFFGIWTGIGDSVGIAGAALAAWLIANVAWPLNFALCFLVTFGAFIVSYVLLALGREPARVMTPQAQARTSSESRRPAVAVRRQLGDVFGLLRADSGLRRLIVSNALLGIATAAGAFYAVAALRRGGLGYAGVSAESTVLLLASTVGNFLWGAIGDHFGHKAVLMWGALCLAASAALAVVAHGFVVYGAVFLLLGLFMAANNLAGLTFIAEYGPNDRRPTYIALAAVAYAPFVIGAPLIGGWLADSHGYVLVFVLSALAGLGAAIGFQFWVPNPRTHRDAPDTETDAWAALSPH